MLKSATKQTASLCQNADDPQPRVVNGLHFKPEPDRSPKS